MLLGLPLQLIQQQHIAQCTVVQGKGYISHSQREQGHCQRGGAQLLRNAARRYYHQQQAIHRQHRPVAQQQLAHQLQCPGADAVEPGLYQRVIAQQHGEDQRDLLIRHKEQPQQADSGVRRPRHGDAALHAHRCNEKACHRRCDEHGNGDDGAQQHQCHAQCRRHAAVRHGPAFAFSLLHGISHFSVSTSCSSG